MEIWPGNPYPLGATFDGTGTNFAISSEVAERVELCLVGDRGGETRISMPERDGFVWHCYLPTVQPGQRYGYRVHGPYDPGGGWRCNANKLLLDPYAKAVSGAVDWDPALFSWNVDLSGFPVESGDPDSFNDADSGPHMVHGVVINPFFDWSGDVSPRIPYSDTVIYEAHVKGLTALHPEIPTAQRGTYAGVGHPAIIDHLTRLGISAIELLPVQQFVHDRTLIDQGLSDYWGYNTIGWFAPHNAYSAFGERGEQVQEFKAMVKSLHSAGIEVILDVVFDHTAEGDHRGPTLSLRGIDNANYYRLAGSDPRYYLDDTGTGNTIDAGRLSSLLLIMDSLRYWVIEMHVDGFRFNRAAALARTDHGFDPLSSFLVAVHQDPVINRVKLIAEPWDAGADDSFQVGRFPGMWSEWNPMFRSWCRDLWRGEGSTPDQSVMRLTASADLYGAEGDRRHRSINYIASHDGFTLADLVSYNEKHNEANGAGNRDGESDNRSWNCGVEGPTDEAEVNALRARQQRNFIAMLMLSQGIPMLSHGDELGRTQYGNNNPYCQDSELTWIHWLEADEPLIEFTASVVRLRRRHPLLTQIASSGSALDPQRAVPDAECLDRFGRKIDGRAEVTCFQLFLNGRPMDSPPWDSGTRLDNDLLLLVNAGPEPTAFALPSGAYAASWETKVETVGPPGEPVSHAPGDELIMAARSLTVLVGVAGEWR